ncbi:hypothetical protein LWC33_19725 [Pseudonocardia sp. RS11V-5]|uniref:hypothetical protein n=1 Tax=Pseudonocardia terrae TaxID=2905831 RepID=UPI001E2DB457|nr:hypothetical protein [Pseudonocardia terrae]MCE3553674.1 hypothetical protein [Pseudonocardia terrae]
MFAAPRPAAPGDRSGPPGSGAVPPRRPRQALGLGTDVTRGAWGLISLLSPEAVVGVLHTPATPRARAVVRVLGARHLVQLAAVRLVGTRTGRAGGAVVDGLHALSCLALAAGSPTWRRGACADAVVAGVFAALGAGATARPRRPAR